MCVRLRLTKIQPSGEDSSIGFDMGSKPSDHLPPAHSACSVVLWVYAIPIGGDAGRPWPRRRSPTLTLGSNPRLLLTPCELGSRRAHYGGVRCSDRVQQTVRPSRVANFHVTVGPAAAHHADVTHIAPGAAAAANSRIRLGLGHQLSTPYPSRGPYQRSPMA